MRLTSKQLDFYDENGYAIIEDLIGEELRREIMDNTSRIVAASEYGVNDALVHWDKQIVNGAVTLPEEDRELGVFKISNMQHHDEWFRNYILKAPEQEAISQIMGDDLKLVPTVNSSDAWVEVAAGLLDD